MEIKESTYNGFKRLDFSFMGKNVVVVLPDKIVKGNKWLFKTEYFEAFPAFELGMLKLGYADVHIDTDTRWALEQDTIRQGKLCEFMHKEFKFNKKCFAVGMSCGGMQAIYLASKFPKCVAGVYLDAPVVNLLSCPCNMGEGKDNLYDEFYKMTKMDKSFLIGYRNHPLDHIPNLIKNKIPCFLVAGDSDTTVPYSENGFHLKKAYDESKVPFEFVLKKGVGHHPHGLENNQPIIDFVKKYY